MTAPGDRHDLDCSDVVEAVYLYIDGELSEDVINNIRVHLDDCSPCLREYGIEQEVKALIARSCGETAPEALRASVLQRIQVIRTEMTVTEVTQYRTD
jgi:mycothiol system anti-sigma-R factor